MVEPHYCNLCEEVTPFAYLAAESDEIIHVHAVVFVCLACLKRERDNVHTAVWEEK